MVRIAVITAATNTIPRFREDMLIEFCNRGNEVVVLGDEPPSCWRDYFKKLGVSYRSYFVSRNGLNPIEDITSMRDIKRILVEEKIEKVFTYQAKPNIYGSLAAQNAGIDDVYVMIGGLGSVFQSGGIKNYFVRVIVSLGYRKALKKAKAVFFQNKDDEERFRHFRIVDNETNAVLTRGSGVNLAHFSQKDMPDDHAFLFVGRLVRGKGVNEFLRAAAEVKRLYPSVTFHVVGPYDSNPTSIKPEELVPYIDDGTVVYHGEVDDVRFLLKECSCFVLPSYYGEGTPKSALEAMSTGRPLIMADSVGCREVVRDGRNGYLIEPRKVAPLVDAMCKIIGDPSETRRMATESRRMAEELFDVRRVNAVICETMGIA